MTSFLSYFKTPSISYGITVCNEAKELRLLLESLIPMVNLRKDEIIILQDVTNRDAAVDAVIKEYENQVVWLENRLAGDFATFKNHLVKTASKDYLFQIDADEIPKKSLIKNLKSFLRKHYYYDVFLVPRINIVNGITPQHIEQWNWKVNEQGYINFPDFQERILKLNDRIFWKNKVHETLMGYERSKNLPSNTNDYCLIHEKEIAKQESQNQFYEQLG